MEIAKPSPLSETLNQLCTMYNLLDDLETGDLEATDDTGYILKHAIASITSAYESLDILKKGEESQVSNYAKDLKATVSMLFIGFTATNMYGGSGNEDEYKRK